MDWVMKKVSAVEQELNASMSSNAAETPNRRTTPEAPMTAPAGTSGDRPSDTNGSARAAPGSAPSSRTSSQAGLRRASGQSESSDVNLSEMLGNADTPVKTPRASGRVSDASTPGDASTDLKKLKRMAVKFKKENETLKASLATAEEQASAAQARIAQLEAEAEAAASRAPVPAPSEPVPSPVDDSAVQAAESAAADAKAELQKVKKLALGLKKKNAQLTEQLEAQKQQQALSENAVGAGAEELATLRRELDEAKESIASLQSKLEEAQTEASTLQSNLETTTSQHQADTQAKDEDLAALRIQLEEAQAAVQATREAAATSDDGNADTDALVATVRSEYEQHIATLQAQVTYLNAQLENAKAVRPPSTSEQSAGDGTTDVATSPDGQVTDDALAVAVEDAVRTVRADADAKERELNAQIDALRSDLANAVVAAQHDDAAAADTTNAELDALRSDVVRLQAELATALQASEAAAAGQGDAVQAAISEAIQAATDEHKEELDALVSSMHASEERVAVLQKEVEKAHTQASQDKSTIATLKKDLESAQAAAAKQSAALTQEIEALKNERERVASDGADASDAIKELAEECATLRADLQQMEVAKARLETSLSNEREALAAAKEKLSAANAGASQQAMLDLELADYKRTAESLNSRVSELEEQVDNARKAKEDAEAKVKEMKAAHAKEEELKKKGEDSRVKMKAMLLQFKKELNERRADSEKSEKAQRELQDQLEARNQEIETLKTEFATINMQLTEVEAEKRELETSKDVAMHSVKFELETVRRDLQQAQSQSAEAARELASYKARAHTLLKQKQDEEQVAVRADLEREAAAAAELRQQIDAIKAELAEANAHVAEVESEADELGGKLEQANRALEQQQQTLQSKVQALQDAAVTSQQEHMEAMSQLRMEHSMALRSHRDKHAKTVTELEKREESLRRELADARAQLSALETASEVSASSAHRRGDPNESSNGASTGGTLGQPTIVLSTSGGASGGDGGGNASGSGGSGTTTASHRSPAPTRKVSTDLASKVSDLATLLVTPTAEAPTAASEAETKLAAANRHIQHMATLLAESESSVERLAEQSKVLKQEIRRHEANSERDKGSNLEYIKNVVFKFITAEDEREQLIPVVGMLLKFTNDEVKEATKKFRIIRAAEKERAAAATGDSSWGGVLQRWS
eukprot:m.28641 g.28641  ORF g.28641 m.28641 type:complete len:1174 (+) comp4535_c0_seq1:167-3688(+)